DGIGVATVDWSSDVCSSDLTNSTNSEHDWAWVLHELASGKDAAKLTRKLASRRSDKPNPLYYAQRTVDVASARLWLIEGVPIDEIGRASGRDKVTTAGVGGD